MARAPKDINIQLVAEQAGVSVASVSRVINNRTDVSEKLREKVRKVIDKVNFTPDKGERRTFNLGVVMSQDCALMDEYHAEAITGMAAFIGTVNAELSILFTGGTKPRDILRQARERRCDGIVLSARDLHHMKALERARVPAMVLNSPCQSEYIGFVNNDAYAGGCQALEHLIGLGHRRIAFLAMPMEDEENHLHRYKAYIDTMEKHGNTPEKHWVVEHIATYHGQEAGYLQAKLMFERAPEVTAAVATNDMIAQGLYAACWETGRRIPDDLSVVGFDDLTSSSYLYPPLTTVAQPVCEISRKIAAALYHHWAGDLPALPRETMDTRLVVRHSTRAI